MQLTAQEMAAAVTRSVRVYHEIAVQVEGGRRWRLNTDFGAGLPSVTAACLAAAQDLKRGARVAQLTDEEMGAAVSRAVAIYHGQAHLEYGGRRVGLNSDYGAGVDAVCAECIAAATAVKRGEVRVQLSDRQMADAVTRAAHIYHTLARLNTDYGAGLPAVVAACLEEAKTAS